MDQEQEKELVLRARKEPTAFALLYNEHFKKIFGYVLRRVGEPTVAQDLTADTFYKALTKLPQFRGSVPFSAWLYRIAGNEVNQYFRSGAKRKTTSLEILLEDSGFIPPDSHDLLEELQEIEAKLEQHQKFLALQKEIVELPEKYQEVITLRYFEEKKLAEVADILGKKEGTVKSLLSRGLEKLRERMEAHAMQPSTPPRIMNSEGRKNIIP